MQALQAARHRAFTSLRYLLDVLLDVTLVAFLDVLFGVALVALLDVLFGVA